jgi:hypothetical protein
MTNRLTRALANARRPRTARNNHRTGQRKIAKNPDTIAANRAKRELPIANPAPGPIYACAGAASIKSTQTTISAIASQREERNTRDGPD